MSIAAARDGARGRPMLQAFDLILFGGTGDLAMRKLLPALYRRHVAGQFAPGSRIIGIARGALSREQYLAQVETHCRQHAEAGIDPAAWARFAECVDYVSADASRPESFGALGPLLAGREPLTRIFFLSTAPTLFAGICDLIGQAGLVTPLSRVVLEKPLGQDRISAADINAHVAAYFEESQIFRIDHYLGKEAVQNLLALRFANALFEPLWRRGRIRHVQITVAETLGVETRGPFYDQTGALRDMVQNHLLQLLCIIAMEPPSTSDADAMRDEKLKVLRALRPIAGADVGAKVVRGQYKAGASQASQCLVMPRSRECRPAARPKPSSRSRPRSIPGAGPECRSTCAPASACRKSSATSSSPSTMSRIPSSAPRRVARLPTG